MKFATVFLALVALLAYVAASDSERAVVTAKSEDDGLRQRRTSKADEQPPNSDTTTSQKRTKKLATKRVSQRTGTACVYSGLAFVTLIVGAAVVYKVMPESEFAQMVAPLAEATGNMVANVTLPSYLNVTTWYTTMGKAAAAAGVQDTAFYAAKVNGFCTAIAGRNITIF